MLCEAASRIPPGTAIKMYLCHPVGGKTRDRTTCKQNHMSTRWISGFLMLGKTQNPQGTFWMQLWSITHGSNCRFVASSLLAQIQPRSADFKETFTGNVASKESVTLLILRARFGLNEAAGLVQSKSNFFQSSETLKINEISEISLFLAVYSKNLPSYLTLPYLTYGTSIFWFDFHFTSASLHFNLGSWLAGV